MQGLMLTGRLVSDKREGANFTQLEWARHQFIRKLGIDPFPGTLNLILESPAARQNWEKLRDSPGIQIIPPTNNWCMALCYPVRVMNQIPGAIVYPILPGYSRNQVEVIAALSIRDFFSLQDGDQLILGVTHALKVKAVIFNVDGTLVDSLEAYRVVAQQAARELDTLITDRTIRCALNTGQSFWEMILPEETPDRQYWIKRFKSKAISLWPEVLRQHGRIFPGVREILKTLRARGAKLGILSGSRVGAFQPLEVEGLMEFFDVILTGKEVDKRKPSPEGLLKCAQMLDAPASQCVYVGDAAIDIEASKAAGMASVAVLSGAGDSALLSACGPDWIIYAISQLPGVLEIGP
jgi:HAD superfamily hydrolase (TIGR01549 family)